MYNIISVTDKFQGTVTYTCKPQLLGRKRKENHIWRTAQVQSYQDSVSNEKPAMVEHACNPMEFMEERGRNIMVWDWRKVWLYLKGN
jgi:hypothetical protein